MLSILFTLIFRGRQLHNVALITVIKCVNCPHCKTTIYLFIFLFKVLNKAMSHF